MSKLSLDSVKQHPLFAHLVKSFPDERTWLLEATLEELTAGSHPTALIDNDKTFDEYFVKNLFKKVENVDMGYCPDERAFTEIKTFLRNQEDVNLRVATILRNLDSAPSLKRILVYTRRWFHLVFKSFNPNDVQPRYTSGATVSLPRGRSIFDRYKAAEGARHLQQSFWTLSDLEYASSFEGSSNSVTYPRTILTGLIYTPYLARNATSDFFVRLSAVPKTAKISRIVGIQPSVVLAQQVGLGDHLTDVLRKHCGIDISTAPELHKVLAMDGSLGSGNSTMDQQHASDNILRILCEWLLPEQLFSYMSLITPSVLEIDGVRSSTHMMCPAGNGFLFPFQTMLFWALIRSTQRELGNRHPHWVFGDDVILHSDSFDAVTKVFEAIGLKINESKSFNDGPFRESCGGDFLFGSNVRPLYVKRFPTSTTDWIRVINGIRRIGFNNNANVWRSDSFRSLWLRCIRTIPQTERLYCPRHYGDAGINTEFQCFYRLSTPTNRGCADSTRFEITTNSPRIKLYVSFLGGEKKSFLEVSKGIPAKELTQLLLDPSVKGAGRVIRKDGTKYYPQVFNGTFEGYRQQNVDFTPFGSAPLEIDELFEFLERLHPDLRIHQPQDVVATYQSNKQKQLEVMIESLRALVSKRTQYDEKIKQDLEAFTLF